MKRNKHRTDHTPLDQLFDDPEETVRDYTSRDEDAERRISQMEKSLEREDSEDMGWGFYKRY